MRFHFLRMCIENEWFIKYKKKNQTNNTLPQILSYIGGNFFNVSVEGDDDAVRNCRNCP